MRYYFFVLTILFFLCIVNSHVYSYDYAVWKVESAEGIDITNVWGKDKKGKYGIRDNYPIIDENGIFLCSLCVIELEEMYEESFDQDPGITVYKCNECKRKYTRTEFKREEYRQWLSPDRDIIIGRCGFGEDLHWSK